LARGRKGAEAGMGAEKEGAAKGVEREEDVVVELGRTRYGMWKAMTKVRCSVVVCLPFEC
jgi:hypothetical protein